MGKNLSPVSPLVFGRLCFWAAILLYCTVAVVACGPVGPDFHPPKVVAAAGWQTPLSGGVSEESLSPESLARWWTVFNDPLLAEFINRAVAGNLDLQQAYGRIHEARARLGLSRAEVFPSLGGSGSATRSRSRSRNQDLYAAGFDAGWELDIFGGVRRAVEAARNDLAASREDLRDVLVTLLGEVAVNYIEVRTYQARLGSATENIKTQEETWQLTSWRFQAGLGDELAVQQASYNLAGTRARLPTLRAGLESGLNRLAVLIGQPPGQIRELLRESAQIPAPPVTVAVGVPAETMRQRPDLRKAERQLAAATARIGVAVSELYPKFRLSGSIGVESVDSADILAAAARTSRFGPSFSWALFNGGQIHRNIEVRSAQQEQSLSQYNSTLLQVLEEVENALTAYVEEQRRSQDLAEAAEAARSAAGLARDKYKAGLQNFSTVLDAQRSLLSFEDQLVQSQGAVSSDLVRLYKALGGGWQSLAAEPEGLSSANKEQQ